MKNDDRIRKVDIEKLPEEELEQLGEQLGKKVGALFQDAADKSNAILQIYGLEVKIGYEIVKKQ